MWRYPEGDRDRFSLGWALELELGQVKELDQETTLGQETVMEMEMEMEMEKAKERWWYQQ